MPSLATRRRRAAAAERSSIYSLEGGGVYSLEGSSSSSSADVTTAGTGASSSSSSAAKAEYILQQQQQDQQDLVFLMQRAHMIVFPVLLFLLLSLFCNKLHITWLGVVFIPLFCSMLIFGLSLLWEKLFASTPTQQNAERQVFQVHGPGFLCAILATMLFSITVAQRFFHD